MELHKEPKRVGEPDGLVKDIVDFFDDAVKRLDIAIQELDSIGREVSDARSFHGRSSCS